jgi:poly(3-hydroxybutyrate) depolymerase
VEAVVRIARNGVFAVCVFMVSMAATAKESVNKSTFEFEGKSRIYYSYVPEIPGPMPVVVLLHGSGRNGQIMADAW